MSPIGWISESLEREVGGDNWENKYSRFILNRRASFQFLKASSPSANAYGIGYQ